MATNKAILISRPHHDPVTKYLCEWSEDVVDLARAKQIPIYDLKGQKANKGEFDSYIKKQNPSFIFLNGHGNSQEITGDGNKTIVDSGSVLTNKIVYARSCDAGQLLGHNLINNGASAFIGYKRKFAFLYSPEKLSRPKDDNIAQIFLAPSNLVASTLLKEHTVADAHGRSVAAMYKNFVKLLVSTASYEERYAAKLLWSNLRNQVLLGSPSVSI